MGEMTIDVELQAELEDAMRTRDRARLDVIRQIRTEAKVRASAPGFTGALDDELYRDVMSSYVKKMAKAKEEYEGLGERGAAMAEKLGFEIAYLQRWLPRVRDPEETRRLVREAITELGVDDPRQAGRVIGHLMKIHPGELDGSLVSALVREELE